MRPKAKRLNQEAIGLEEEGRIDEAIAGYEAAIEVSPEWAVPWFNLGLLYKRQRCWEACLRFNRKATELAADDKPAWWNLGIAATALGDWATARAAWKGFGLEIAEGEGPIELDWGLVPIRLRPADVGEVVWSQRIDPARAILDSVPLPESGRRWRDLVLHDGAPNGYRMLRDREVPVFDEIELLAASPFSTFVAQISCADPRAVGILLERFDQIEDVRAEDWTANVRFLCQACSEGRPHEHHDDEGAGAQEWRPDRRLGIAAIEAGRAQAVLDEWSRSGNGHLVSCEQALAAPFEVS
ncbi:MAG TPA: tetratricopeptide repeat protein [Thermoanaerobaculia bacterium]|jgi:hypothetical protein|nr:tetratricopeptide repeat protein [Thermoanaerobaculia bacterium]